MYYFGVMLNASPGVNKTSQMNRYSALNTFSEAKYLLNDKTRQLNPFYDQLETAFEEKLTLGNIKQLQSTVFAHHHDMVALRNSFDAIKGSDKSCVIDDWNTARRQCENHIKELRYYEGRLTDERKEIIQEKENKILWLDSIFSYAFLYPAAAGGATKLIPGIHDAIPIFVVLFVASAGLTYRYMKGQDEGKNGWLPCNDNQSNNSKPERQDREKNYSYRKRLQP